MREALLAQQADHAEEGARQQMKAKYHDSESYKSKLKDMGFEFGTALDLDLRAQLTKNCLRDVQYELNNNQLAISIAAAIRLEKGKSCLRAAQDWVLVPKKLKLTLFV